MAKFTFTAGWKSTLLLLVVIPIFLGLGTWQLNRAKEKESIAAIYAERESMLPIELRQADNFEDKSQLQIAIKGEFREQHFLLENQWRNKKLGVEVISLFYTLEGQIVLLNRGWLANEDRRNDPTFATPTGQQTYQVTIYQPSKEPYRLGDLVIKNQEPIQRIAYMDVSQLANALNESIYPYELRIVDGIAGKFDTHWPVINVKPETHVGYAVQWYLFAVIAVLVFLFANSNLAQVIRNKN